MGEARTDEVFDGEPGGAATSRIESLFREHNDTLLRFLRAYLFRIAANVATDLLRRRAVQSRVQQDDLFFETDAPATQERALQAREQLAAVEIALSELPPRCREAFLLSRREGWASGRIAAHLGVSDRMVRLYLVRALEHLEAAL